MALKFVRYPVSAERTEDGLNAERAENAEFVEGIAPRSRRAAACYRTFVNRFRFIVLTCLSVTISTVLLCPATAVAQTPPNLTGHWRLNPALSQLPKELGFDAD